MISMPETAGPPPGRPKVPKPDSQDDTRDRRGVVPWHPDRATRDDLVERYGHLIKYVVGRLGVSVSGVFDHEDAMQAGAIGLLQAIDGYRPEAAASFESYALVRIRGSILDGVRALDMVGRAGREAARAIQGAMRDLHEELGRPAGDGELANRLGMTVERYHERLAAASVVTVSLDEVDGRNGDDDSSTLGDMVVDDKALAPLAVVEDHDQVDRLAAAIGGLDERQRMVLGLYYQDELTLREIGEVLGVTESRVCQIRSAAILTLRGRLGAPESRGRGHARTMNRPGGGAARGGGAATDAAEAGLPLGTRPALGSRAQAVSRPLLGARPTPGTRPPLGAAEGGTAR